MRRRYTIETASDIFMMHGYILMENEYKSSKHRMRFYCPDCDSEQTLRLNDLTQGHFCPQCGNLKKAERMRELATSQRLSTNAIKSELAGRGLELVGKYKNAHVKIKYKCNKHPKEIQSARINDLRSYECCARCSVSKRRLDYSEVLQRFNDRGYLLMTSKYENSDTKMSYVCEKHIDFLQQITVSDITQGHGCYYCGLEKISGKNHYKYNPSLTSDDRKFNRKYDLRTPKWRLDVFRRDYFTCQVCWTKGNPINAHHKDGFNWCKDRRYDISNGVTLCEDCHKDFHRTYGYGNNTEQQFKDYLESQRGVR